MVNIVLNCLEDNFKNFNTGDCIGQVPFGLSGVFSAGKTLLKVY